MSDNRIGRAWIRKNGRRESGREDLPRFRSRRRGRPVLDADDWAAIDRLLNDPDDRDLTEELNSALARLDAQLTDNYVSADTMINVLLDVWVPARAVGPETAAPVEQFLTCLSYREILTCSEAQAVAEAVRHASGLANPHNPHPRLSPTDQT